MLTAKKCALQLTTSSCRESAAWALWGVFTLSKTNPHIFVSFKVILASGYYAAFRVTLVAKALEGLYDGAIHITTDYEVELLFNIGLFYIESVWWCDFYFIFSLPSDINHPSESCHCSGYIKQLSQTHHFTIIISSKQPLRFHTCPVFATSRACHVYVCVFFFFQGKVVHQSYSIQSSFTQKVRLQQIRSLTEDIRFYYKRLRNNKDELEPRRKSKVALYLTGQH